jgi:Sulfotransferase domain
VTRHFLVIGAQRSGTTYLRTLLEAHPDVAMNRPPRPEPKVFLSAELTGRGLGWYRSTYFAHVTNETLLGEKSTSYIECAEAADRAVEMLGDAAIVVLLRDPVERAVSNWQFSTENGYERRPLEEALRANLLASHPWTPGETSVSPYLYLERGRYVTYLPPWTTAFPDGVRVLFLHDLLTQKQTLADVYAHLGVDAEFVPDCWGAPINQSSEPAPELAPGLEDELRAYFAVSDEALARLLGEPVPWPSQR